MKPNLLMTGLSGAIALMLGACGVIRPNFPDKEKDYQFATEIAPLTLPADIEKRKNPDPVVSESASAPQSSASIPNESAASEPIPAETAPIDSAESAAPVAEESEKPVTAQLLKEDGNTTLRITTPVANAWRMVDKALTRRSVEVTRRDQAAAIFTVLHDPKERSQQDDSILDELKFIFKGFDNNEKAYVVSLEGDGGGTDVTLLNSDQQPVNDEHSLSLLQLLYEAITADLAEKTPK